MAQRQRSGKRCIVTGKTPLYGNRVSHSNIKTRHRQMPNVRKRRFWVAEESRWITLPVSNRGVKIISKRGIFDVISELRARGETI